MSRPTKPPRLYLRERDGREPVWVIRDAEREMTTGAKGHEREKAENALRKYTGRQEIAFSDQGTNGFVYFIQAGNLVKIGFSADPENRLAALQTAHGLPLKMLCCVPGSKKIEMQYHRKLQAHRYAGEWFKLNKRTSSIIETAKASFLGRAPETS